MNYDFTVYDVATGVIVMNGNAKLGNIAAQTEQGQGFIIGWFEPGEWLIIGDEPTPIPGPTQAEADLAARVAWRARARLTRSGFCNNCVAAGVLTATDAIAAAKGDWPASMAGALALMTPEESAAAQIAWASAAVIHRADPFIAVVQSFLALSDNAVDDLFGWSAT